jgi:hypothetical protein
VLGYRAALQLAGIQQLGTCPAVQHPGDRGARQARKLSLAVDDQRVDAEAPQRNGRGQPGGARSCNQPRRYDQRLRAEAAEETRRRVLDALYERLKAEPSRPVSVDEIAQIARVARSTIYLVFGSRAGLFDALAAELFRSGEFALVEAAVANPNARESLRDGLLGGARMFAAHRDVFRVLYSMAELDANAWAGR